jgi:hypothetical protein
MIILICYYNHDYINSACYEIKNIMEFSFGVSEWLLFNTNSVIFQLYHGKNKLIFNEMMMSSTLS